jgi:hypothetical protein
MSGIRSAPAALGKYQIRGMLGRGAIGTVYDGWDPVIGRRVAILEASRWHLHLFTCNDVFQVREVTEPSTQVTLCELSGQQNLRR